MQTKRLFSILLALVLLCACAVPATVRAVNLPTLSLEELSVQTNGDLQMHLQISDNPGIVALLVKVQYDHSVLALTNAANGEVFPDSTALFNPDFASEEYTMTWLDALSTTDYTANGTLATLTFHVLDSAAAGKSAVTLSYDAGSTFNSTLSPVTCALQNGSVTVSRPVIAVKGVSLPERLTMDNGSTYSLKATVSPSNATDPSVSWKSSDDKTVAVDANGKLTAKRVGTATITVTTTDGGKTATCRVTVVEPVIAVTGVTLPSTLTITYKDPAQLTATVLPKNATDPSVTWKSSDEKIVTVDANGNLTSHRAGTANITVTTRDGGKQATCAVTVKYTFLQKIIIYLLFGFIWYLD